MKRSEKIADYLVTKQKQGYSLKDSWLLFLNSKEIIFKEDIETTNLFEDETIMFLLGDFIERAHSMYDMEYERIFEKCDIDTFMKTGGRALGNYDDKLIKNYLL